MKELEAVRINDIEKLILLADDVVIQMEYHFYMYDEDGYSIDKKWFKK